MPTNVLVSGAPERIAPVSKVLRDHDCTVVEVDNLDASVRGDGGYGSTGGFAGAEPQRSAT